VGVFVGENSSNSDSGCSLDWETISGIFPTNFHASQGAKASATTEQGQGTDTKGEGSIQLTSLLR
jgi:hypothetical protein